MPKESNQPIVALIACPEHWLPMTTIVETGPNISDADMELVSETLMCWRCRESDEDGILRMLQAIGVPPAERVQVHRHAFSNKPKSDA